MADEALPDEFGVIVVGTGLSESILSGALSRIGKKVLQLDHNKHYGSAWSSFNLRGFESLIASWEDMGIQERLHEMALEKIDKDTELFVPIKSVRKTMERGESICYIPHQIGNKDISPSEDCNEIGQKTFATLTSTGETKLPTGEPEEKDVQDVPGPSHTEEGSPSDTTEQKAQQNLAKNEEDIEKVGETGGIIKSSFEKEEIKPRIQKLSRESFYESWRQYNLDLAPKLMFSRGKLVELLITSNVSRYLEFRNVTRTLTLLDNGTDRIPQLAPVPCSRTDVFTSKFVTMIEKRMLMRVLTMCANYENHPEEYEQHVDGHFLDFLAAKRLSKKLQHFILHSIAMVDESVSTLDGLKATQKFLNSLGRYGNSAFLWPLYGVGELPQAFCRLSAVFGGTFCLSRSLCGFIVNKDSGKCIGIVDTTGQRLNCEHLIIDECYVPEAHRVPFSNVVSRAIYITDKSILPSDSESVSLITIPPMHDLPSSRLIEVGGACCVCPQKQYVVHAMTSISGAESPSLATPCGKFLPIEKLLFQDFRTDGDAAELVTPSNASDGATVDPNKPNVLWVSYFNMMSGGVDTNSIPENVHVTRGPSMDLGFDGTVLEAKRLFETICPDEEFLPRAPNPDEIVFFEDDEGYNTESTEAVSNPTLPEGGGEYGEDESEGDFGSGEVRDPEQEMETTQEEGHSEEAREHGGTE